MATCAVSTEITMENTPSRSVSPPDGEQRVYVGTEDMYFVIRIYHTEWDKENDPVPNWKPLSEITPVHL